MGRTRQLAVLMGLLTTIAAAAYMVVRLDGQVDDTSRDFTNAAMAEVRDSQGAPLLRGTFVLVEEDDDDVERKAALKPVGSDPDASGEAEVEFDRTTPLEQEIEFSVRNLDPGASITMLIDGHALAAVTTDGRGAANIELEIRLPAASAGR